MTQTVHKLLIHGSEIIESAIVPIGQLSEEAQEYRNKDVKNYRRNLSRRNSRINSNRDLINRLLLSSDPALSFYGGTNKTKKKELTLEAQWMLKEMEDFSNSSDEPDYSSDEN